ncbi:hypothetical protein JMM81_12480 [Bacillus sp. V3B]|uniref:hypothetical protein n=1 Tax=Bacillus sp. V3B TaxID=2804915 RepID=UPI00210B109B|nr:hypothetical protein [Bacillus sp. V3B]MCQ6275772.1 hypothetical protein [Bacillus sp. V3B]
MEKNYTDRYYDSLFGNDRMNVDIVLDKEQLLSLAALTIDLKQPEWLSEIETRLKELG